MQKPNEEELLLNPAQEDSFNEHASVGGYDKAQEKRKNEEQRAQGNPVIQETPPQQQPNDMKAKAKSTFNSFMGWASKVADDVGKELDKGLQKIEEAVEKEVHTRNFEGEREFHRIFNLPETERLLGVFGCRVLTGQEGLAGAGYLSVSYFCFNGSDLKIMIPLQTILRVQKAVRVRNPATVDNIGPKYTFAPVEPAARGDCLMLYTNDNMIHHFFSDYITYGPMHNVVLTFESWYRLVDETWKSANRFYSAPHTYSPQPNLSGATPEPSSQAGGYPAPYPQQQQPQQQPGAAPPGYPQGFLNNPQPTFNPQQQPQPVPQQPTYPSAIPPQQSAPLEKEKEAEQVDAKRPHDVL